MGSLRIISGTFFLLATHHAFSANRFAENEPPKPNIIYILADDLGYGDLSFNGQRKFQTPNIDRLAAKGMIFTQHYSGCTVCAPSRSSLMTGTHTGHTPIRDNMGGYEQEGQLSLPENILTMPEVLKNAGYTTGAFGKWGLGAPGTEGDPNNKGFDEFFGYNCQVLAHYYYPDHLWHNQEKIELEGNEGNNQLAYAPNLIHKKALEFIEINKDKLFFMYYPSIIPHAELVAPEEYMKRFRGKFLPEKSFKGVEPGSVNFRKGSYGSQMEAHAAFAAMVSLLDDQVGEIVAKLEELGLTKSTIIVFTSDNGPHLEGGADPDYFNSNGPFRGYKRDLYEGGIRVPMIAKWPEKIKPGSTTDHVSAFWDILPTFAELAGLKVPKNIDGISFYPTLIGKGRQKKHDFLYWEFHPQNGRQAIRKANWKLIKYNVLTPSKTITELYDLKNDPGEENNLILKHKGIAKKLNRTMNAARVSSDNFPFVVKN